jgi:uncharacterized repeat protein (TIGR03803 family)
MGLFAAQTQAQTYQVLAAFTTEGANPQAGVIEVAGAYYGTTVNGGNSGKGTIFRIDAGTGTFTTLHHFSGTVGDGAYPYAALILASDGNLYGTTSSAYGGSGTIFRIAPDGSGFTTLHVFQMSDGAVPKGPLILASDGNLYGTTHEGGAHNSGTIFKMDTAGAQWTTLYQFAGTDGSHPLCGLLQAADGNLYGTTTGGGASGMGTIFRIDTDGTLLTTLYDFAGSDGDGPAGALVQDAGGMLYGTTGGGGSDAQGTIFRVDTGGTTLTTLYSFTGLGDGWLPAGDVLLGGDGNLYGATQYGGSGSRGTVFRIATSGSGFETLHSFTGPDGAYPRAAVIIADDGMLYGTTDDTGNLPVQFGTVFRLGSDGSAFETLHELTPFPLGTDPKSEPISRAADPSSVYGTTVGGGAHGFGTVYRVGTDGSAYAVLHNFTFSDGARPSSHLVEGPDGLLYGTTSAGGTGSGPGTIFKIDPAGTTLTTIHFFSGTDGSTPSAALIVGADGFLYGTTESGGGVSSNYGTVYKVATDGTGFLTLHSFGGSDGWNPRGRILQADDGNLYGTTVYGGANGVGTVYRMDTSGSNFATLHDFATTDGANPYAGLIQAPDGFLYGGTWVGGDASVGTLFRIDTAGSVLTTLHSFSTSDGVGPEAALLLATDGNLYGTGIVGGAGACLSGCGTVYRIGTDGGGFATVYTFQPGSGDGATAGLTQGVDGSLYGATESGGAGNGGVIYRLELCQVASPPVIAVDQCIAANTSGLMASVASKAGASYAWTLVGGTIDSGQGTSAIDFTSGGPGTSMKLFVVETDSTGCLGEAQDSLQVDFLDVPPLDPLYAFVCTIGRDGISVGCGGGDFCRDDPVTRAQMAVFLLRAQHSAAYVPPPCGGIFPDVPCPGQFTDWIEQLFREGITAGCGEGNYCPADPVTRAQMSAFLLKARHGSAYRPPTCAGRFGDVPCPSLFADWIEELAAEGITAGCGNGDYCPSLPNTRGQMAVFLTKTFSLQ